MADNKILPSELHNNTGIGAAAGGAGGGASSANITVKGQTFPKAKWEAYLAMCRDMGILDPENFVVLGDSIIPKDIHAGMNAPIALTEETLPKEALLRGWTLKTSRSQAGVKYYARTASLPASNPLVPMIGPEGGLFVDSGLPIGWAWGRLGGKEDGKKFWYHLIREEVRHEKPMAGGARKGRKSKKQQKQRRRSRSRSRRSRR